MRLSTGRSCPARVAHDRYGTGSVTTASRSPCELKRRTSPAPDRHPEVTVRGRADAVWRAAENSECLLPLPSFRWTCRKAVSRQNRASRRRCKAYRRSVTMSSKSPARSGMCASTGRAPDRCQRDAWSKRIPDPYQLHARRPLTADCLNRNCHQCLHESLVPSLSQTGLVRLIPTACCR